MAKQDNIEQTKVETPRNHLLGKIPNPDALRGAPDPILLARLETAIEREKRAYQQEMSKDVQALIDLLHGNARPGALWPIAHEIRCMAGTFDYPFLTEVAQVLCMLIKKHQTMPALPVEVSDVFARALHRARNHMGELGEEEEKVVEGLQRIAIRHMAAA